MVLPGASRASRNCRRRSSLFHHGGTATLLFSRMDQQFSGIVGESLGEHIRRLRLERAAIRLRDTEDAVIVIALSAGYEAHEAFTRAFGATVLMLASSSAQGSLRPPAVPPTSTPLRSMVNIRFTDCVITMAPSV